jgi:hypothetical protein
MEVPMLQRLVFLAIAVLLAIAFVNFTEPGATQERVDFVHYDATGKAHCWYDMPVASWENGHNPLNTPVGYHVFDHLITAEKPCPIGGIVETEEPDPEPSPIITVQPIAPQSPFYRYFPVMFHWKNKDGLPYDKSP